MTTTKPLAELVYLGHSKVRRSATCPTHNKRTSEFRGEQQELVSSAKYWCFMCRHTRHIFLALIPRDAPGSAAEVMEWMKQKEAEMAGIEYDSGGR